MIRISQIFESDSYLVDRWQRLTPLYDQSFFSPRMAGLDLLDECSSLWSAVEEDDYLAIALAHYDTSRGVVEVGALLTGEEERNRGVGSVLAQLTLAQLLVAEQPLILPGVRVVAYVPPSAAVPRQIVERALRFRPAATGGVGGDLLPAGDPVSLDCYELALPDTLEAIASWAENWTGLLPDGEMAEVELTAGLRMQDMARALWQMSSVRSAKGATMRYRVKAYPMHEHEQALVHEAGLRNELEILEEGDGVIACVADEATIKRLSDSGLVVQAIAMSGEHAAAGAHAGEDVSLESVFPQGEVTTFGARPRPAGYFLVELPGGVSDTTIAALESNGAELVERDPSGMYVVRSDRSAAELRQIGPVAGVRTYGTSETLEGAVTKLAPHPDFAGAAARAAALPQGSSEAAEVLSRTGLFEAILHRVEDGAGVSAQLDALGARVVSRSTRSIRFVPKQADLSQIAELPGVASVARRSAVRSFHDRARPLVGVESGDPNRQRIPFNGTGEIVGVADTGLDDQHPDFAGRVVGLVALGRPNDASDPDGHGTHVAGTVLGSGAASNADLAGIAPAAQLYFQSILDVNGRLGGLPDPLTGLFQQAYDAGVRIHNNSWGAYLQSRYDSMALDVDEFVHNNPDFLPVIAAGNQGSCRPGLNSEAGFVDFPSLGAPATAKNGLTVGASRSDRTAGGLAPLKWKVAWPGHFEDQPIAGETVSGDDQGLAAFSSRGPCDDMRIKPDLVAPGTDIASTRSSLAPLSHFWGAYPSNPRYAFNGGTSMASPIVAGCAALVRQYYRQVAGHDHPSAALLKATLINGTAPLSGADATARPQGYPNYHQGFGRVNMATTLPHAGAPGLTLHFIDTWRRDHALRFTARRTRKRLRIDLPLASEVRICLAWTDYPARALQNAFRMILDDGGSRKWIANDQAAAPVRIAAHDPRNILPGNDRVITRDPQNNVQIIRAALQPGHYYLALFGDNLLRVPQDFALVVTATSDFSMREG